MDYLWGQSTWPLLLGKALFSVLKFVSYLSFSFPDGQPTQLLGNKNAGSPRSFLTLNLFHHIHEPLTQFLLYGIILLKFLPVLAFFFVFIMAHIYCRRTFWKELSSRLWCSLYIFPSHFFRIFSHLFVSQSFQTKNCK